MKDIIHLLCIVLTLKLIHEIYNVIVLLPLLGGTQFLRELSGKFQRFWLILQNSNSNCNWETFCYVILSLTLVTNIFKHWRHINFSDSMGLITTMFGSFTLTFDFRHMRRLSLYTALSREFQLEVSSKISLLRMY